MDVTDWLRSLGLERYAANFRDNEVSADLLATLTSQDLQELGVDAVGHRRRLLDAITALRGESGPAGNQSAVPTGGSPDRDRAFASAAERRHITVLLCDLVGSTQLSTRLDPEDLRQLLHTYRASVVAAVTGQRGYVAKFLGDGVLAYFGWPNADETHADSAVRAALAALEALRPQQLAVRIGIATGLVVVGDLIGAGAAQEHPAIGGAPNLAARLQAVAEPDTVVLSEATRAQLGRMFELEELGPFALKGFDKPVTAWRARGETGASSRSEAIYAGALSPLVGRDEELDLLLRRWRQAKSGEGRVVLLSGEAGIGKSRLLAALEQKLAGEPHVSLRYFCTPYQQDSPLHPIIARLEQEAGCSRGDTAEQRLAKLEAVMARTAPGPDDVPLIASLLSIPTGARYPALELSPRRRKERTFAALIHRLASFASREPVLILFEDAHWSDPTSLELLDAVIEQVPDLPVLLLVAFRADFSPPWFGRPGVSLIALSRLDRRDATALATQVATDHVLSSALLDRIVAQADGVPLFIEELTKAVLEASELGAASASLAVPDTLQASLMARLDRLPTAKQVAQIGAVIGREFSHSLIAAVAQMPEPLLAQGLAELVASGLVFRRGAPPEVMYAFKHALVQDVAYKSLLRSRRAEVHAKIVEMLERDSADARSQLALIGYHCANAGLIEKASLCYRAVGAGPSEKAGFVETEQVLRRGLAVAETLAQGSRPQRLEADLWGALARILAKTKPIPHPDLAAAIERATELSRGVDDVNALGRALFLRWYYRVQGYDYIAGLNGAREYLKLHEDAGSLAGRAVGHVMLAASSFHCGRFGAARANATSVLELGRTLADSDLPPIFGRTSLEVCAGLYSKFALGCLGHIEQARVDYPGLCDQARQLGSADRASVYVIIPHVDHVIFRDIAAFQEHTGFVGSLGVEFGRSRYVRITRCREGWLAVRAGNFDRGLTEMRAASSPSPHCHFLLADALTFSGRNEEALASLDDGLAVTGRTGEAWLDAELHRLRGELLLKGREPDPSSAEQELRTAIEIARGQSAKLFELRAATSLARLWSGQGRWPEARDLLTPVYTWFTEGFASLDLQEARSVLAELGQPQPLH